MRFLPLFLLCGLAVLPARGQTPDTTVVLPEVEVEAVRSGADRAVGQRTTRLGADAIAASGAATAAELLEARTGLFVKRYGAGGPAAVRLRGATTSQTTILMDGLRLTDPQTGQVDLSLIPAVLLESAEVVHGAASARYGSGGLGGAIRLQTLRPRGTQARATATAAAYGERALSAAGGVGSDRLAVVAAAEARQRDGAFPYVNTALVPRRTVRREGADSQAQSAYGRVTWRQAGRHLSLAAWLAQAERGLPGQANAAPGGARQEDATRRLSLTAQTPVPRGTFHLAAGVHHHRLQFTHPTTALADTSRTQTATLTTHADLLAGRRLLVTPALELGQDRAAVQGGVQQTRVAPSLRAQVEGARWRLEPALRLDVLAGEATTLTALSPHLGAEVQPTARRGLTLAASAGRTFRAPTFAERFSEPGGDPDLVPERGLAADAGVYVRSARPGRLAEASLTLFASRVRDQVVWYPSAVSPGVQIWTPANVGRVVTRGLEAAGSARMRWGRWQAEGGVQLTRVHAQNRANPEAPAYGEQLRYVPRTQLALHAGLGRGAVRLDAQGRLVGERPLASDGTSHLDPYGVVDVQLRVEQPVGPAVLSLALAVENLFAADYAIVRLYPMPPRHARLRLGVALP